MLKGGIVAYHLQHLFESDTVSFLYIAQHEGFKLVERAKNIPPPE